MAVANEALEEPNLANDTTFDFIEQSYLTYIVPSKTNIDLDNAFKDVEAGKSLLESIEQRETLFFGARNSLTGTIPQPSLTLPQMKPLKRSLF